MTTCTRSDCGKKLYSGNSKGMCTSGCFSPDAPPSVRAKDVEGRGLGNAPRSKVADEVAATVPAAAVRFRAVHDAMGMDPEKTLEEFYTSWLEGIRQALES